MKEKINLLLLFILIFSFGCQSQTKSVKEINNDELNYVLASILPDKILRRELFNSEAFLKVFEISDSKATSDNSFSETDEVFSSYLISIIPDGDYYTSSQLYKLEGLVNPKIIDILEREYPKFTIIIEHGFHDKKKIEEFFFEIEN